MGNFWPREYDFSNYPLQNHFVTTDPDTQVLVQTQHPVKTPVGEVVLLHGLEGSGKSGYMISMAWHALEAGWIVHRFHMRTCGGTENLCKTLYHAGLTSDLKAFLEQTVAAGRGLPIVPVGFSLGGNVALKLAGELGETDLIAGVCGVSVPIDLGVCTRRLSVGANFLYQRRFVSRMKARLIQTGRYTEEQLRECNTIYEIDDRITAPAFGFGTADNYYATQSAIGFLHAIRVPALLIQAKDDTMIPFELFSHPAVSANPRVKLLATEYGGHVAFLSKRGERFWVNEPILGFLGGLTTFREKMK